MEWVRQWLMGITVAAMIHAVAKTLMPKGVVRKVGNLTGGLVLLLAILQPVYRLDDLAAQQVFSPYIENMEAYSRVPEIDTLSLIKSLIEEECGAYIQDKAREQGIECRVSVLCGGEEGGYPYPVSVCVYGELEEAQKEWLVELIRRDLAVPVEGQIYRMESGEVE